MNHTTDTFRDDVHHSRPIPISTQHSRRRSISFSSESSNSPAPSPPLPTPKNFPPTRIPHSPSSPMFYYLSQSPSKAPPAFPFRGFPPPPVFEDETTEERPESGHMRRGSVSVASRFPPQPLIPEPHHERGVNLLRRLSLGNPLGKPSVDIPQSSVPRTPPNSAVPSSPTANTIPPGRKPRRSATITEHVRPRRAPSPMGERILKGHFDGFN